MRTTWKWALGLGLTPAMLERLKLDSKRIASMAQGLRDVPRCRSVGRVLDERTRPNGLRLRKVAVPIGVVVIIYESRPNVTPMPPACASRAATPRSCAAAKRRFTRIN